MDFCVLAEKMVHQIRLLYNRVQSSDHCVLIGIGDPIPAECNLISIHGIYLET